MTWTTFPNRSLILVCDGAKALLFENAGDAQAINLKALDVVVEPHKPTRMMGSDRPTRVYDSMDGSRSGTEQTDWHDKAETDFLTRFTESGRGWRLVLRIDLAAGKGDLACVCR